MHPTWQEHGYSLITTRDGSPSLATGLGEESEAMHHSGGALTETREIYGRLIAPCFQVPAPRFLSLGLGLGYNELLIAQTAAQQGSVRWCCLSYEADPFLTEAFAAYLEDQLPDGEIKSTYASIEAALGEPSGSLRAALLRAREEGRWVVEGALHAQTPPPENIHGFLWDAFSQKTSPGLWEEDFLRTFIGQAANAERSGFSSYACLGRLKRALKSLDFEVHEMPGFQGKRNSTLAWRGDWRRAEL